ncbi:cobalamin-binding protein [Alcaligenaceae bacterium]|nr:cobalamin-binding protein [Alcaligenaceae bacterium]
MGRNQVKPRRCWISGLIACLTVGLAALPAAAAGLPASNQAVSAPAPSRAITLAPHITELMFAAGAGDKIVATVSSSDFPVAALGIPRVGDGVNINIEKTLTLHPDIVLAWLPSGAARTVAPTLARLNIPLLYSAPKTLDDIASEILRMGTLFHTEVAARSAANALQKRVDALRERYSNRSPVSIFIEVGSAPLYTIGSDALMNDALATCGGVNAYAHAEIAAPQISVETVLVKQPQVVLVPVSGTRNHAQAVARWKGLGLAAARADRVYGVDADELFRPGPRLVDAVERLCLQIEEARS